MKTWIRIPAWVDENGFDCYTVRILTRLFNMAFFTNNNYQNVKYSPTKLSKDLVISKPTVINRINYLIDNNWIGREGNELLLSEFPAGKRDLPKAVKEVDPVNQIYPTVKEINQPVKEIYQSGKPDLPVTPVYDRLAAGFPNPIVFKKYYYSITTVVVVDDLLMILTNIEKLECFYMIRKEKFPGEHRKNFANNEKFKQCLQWIKEIFEEDDQEGDIPVDRYLLYVLLDSFIHAKNPQGKFIAAVEMLKRDGSRIDVDLTDMQDARAKDEMAEELRRRERATLQMIDGLDNKKEIANPLTGKVDFLQVFKNKLKESNQ